MVWRVSRQLDSALAGRVLTRSDFRVPRFATTNLAGRTVHEATARGKHLLIRVEGGVTVHTHLRMDGSWRIWPASRYPPRDHRVRLVLANEAWQAVGYLLGVVEVLPTAREERVVGHLGPDLLGPDWDAAEAVRRLRAAPDRPAGEALLDQANLAGIGNLYKAEVLFLRGISPWRPVGTVDDLEALVELARRLLEANKEHTVAGDHRQSGARPGDLGVRPGRAGLPAVRHRGAGRRLRGPRYRRQPGAGDVLVPVVPARRGQLMTRGRLRDLRRGQQRAAAGAGGSRDQPVRGRRRLQPLGGGRAGNRPVRPAAAVLGVRLARRPGPRALHSRPSRAGGRTPSCSTSGQVPA